MHFYLSRRPGATESMHFYVSRRSGVVQIMHFYVSRHSGVAETMHFYVSQRPWACPGRQNECIFTCPGVLGGQSLFFEHYQASLGVEGWARGLEEGGKR